MLKKIENYLNKNEIEILSQYWKLSKKNMKPCPQSIGSVKKYKDILPKESEDNLDSEK